MTPEIDWRDVPENLREIARITDATGEDGPSSGYDRTVWRVAARRIPGEHQVWNIVNEILTMAEDQTELAEIENLNSLLR